MLVCHIAYRYLPAVGGLERYIGLLLSALEPLAVKQLVFQVESIPQQPSIHGIGKEAGYPNQIGFGLRLRQYRQELSAADLLVVHCPEFFLPVAWHPRILVVSHCATWTGEQSPLHREMRRFLNRLAWRRAPAWVVNSTFVFRSMNIDAAPGCGDFAELAPRRWFVPNCVDTTAFSPIVPPDSALIAHQPSILVPRNFTAPRGIDLAIEAMSKIKDKVPLKLMLAGESIYDHVRQKGYAERLQSMVDKLDLRSRVRFLGFVPPERMPSIYRAATMTLIPTRSSEGTSLAALESMACGIPTLSTNVEGLLDLPTEKCLPQAEDMARSILQLLPHGREIGIRQWAEVKRRFCLEPWQLAWRRIVGGLLDVNQPDDILLAQKAKSC